MKINCAEFASAHEYAKLIGAPPGYVGHGEKSMLAEKAEKSNRWVFLFDEIEKAHHKLFDFLLSLLDEGKVCDNLGKELDFSESIFLFTSNQGVSELRGGKKVGFSDETTTYEKSREQVKESVKKKFTPEFINRVDSFIYFNSLSPEDCMKIAKLSLKDIPIKKHKALLKYIVSRGYSEQYGARNIQRFVKNNVGVKVADMILQKRVPSKSGDMYTPKIVDNELTIVNTVQVQNSNVHSHDISGS
jgi:ATP-dependent Clp protease ATP-binding subunit ClpC